MTHPAYTLSQPVQRSTCVVFASPHSGRDYPAAFLARSRLDPLVIRSSEDAYVDELFGNAPDAGAPFLTARVPRCFVDFNRAADELDPALIADLRRTTPNPRVASGLGVIPRVVAGGRTIYDGKLSLPQAHARITDFWRPWHDTLQTLLDESTRLFGQAILIDCHSMPHEALSQVALHRPDVVIGDRFGTSASAAVVAMVEDALAQDGLRVARNSPFAGAYVTQHYGKPLRHQHAVQIEVNRGLYMNEQTLEKTGNFDDLRNLLAGVVRRITSYGEARDKALAAE